MEKVIAALMTMGMLLSCVPAFATEEITWLIGVPIFGDHWGKDIVSREIMRRTGIQIDVIYVEDSQNQLLNILIATDTPPELITLERTAYQLEQLVSQGQIYNLDELAERCGYSMDALLGTEIAQRNRADDGGLYVCPGLVCVEPMAAVSDLSSLPCLLVRRDLMVCHPEWDFTTPDGFFSALWQMQEENSDLIPLGMMPFTAFGCETIDKILRECLGIPLVREGKYVDALEDTDYLAWLYMISQANQNGLLDEQVFICDSLQVEKRLSVGAYGAYWGDASRVAQALQIAQEQGIVYQLMEGPRNAKGEAPKFSLDCLYYGQYGTAISTRCMHANQAMALMAWMLEEDGQRMVTIGAEGSMWNEKNGTPVASVSALVEYNKNINKYFSIYGGAGRYGMFLHAMEEFGTAGYALDVLTEAREHLQKYGCDAAEQWDVFFQTRRSALAESYLLQKQWGETLPQLLNAQDANTFQATLDHFLSDRQAYGYEAFVQALGAAAQAK